MNFNEYIIEENLYRFIADRSKIIEEERIDIRYKCIRHAISQVGGDRYKDSLVFPAYLDRDERAPEPYVFVAKIEHGVLNVQVMIRIFSRGQDDIHGANRLTVEENEYLLDMIKDDEYYFPL